jgi:hypothetical protein
MPEGRFGLDFSPRSVYDDGAEDATDSGSLTSEETALSPRGLKRGFDSMATSLDEAEVVVVTKRQM